MFKRFLWRLVVCEIVVLLMIPAGALAQSPFARFLTFIGGNPIPSGPSQPMQMQPAFAVTDQPRSSEIAVELAWLADPTTFPYALTARSSGNTLQVQGFVPNENVRQRALWLAKRNTTLSVLDGTRLHPGLAVPAPRFSPALQQNAVQAIQGALPHCASYIRLSAGNNGCVTLSGMAANYEDKLAASHALQQVPGCTCVSNQIQVGGSAPAYARHAPQSARGSFMPFNTPPLVKNTLSRFGFGQSNQAEQPMQMQQPQQPTGDPYAGYTREGYSPYSANPSAPGRETDWRVSSAAHEHMTRPASHTISVQPGQQPRPSPYRPQPPVKSGPPVIARSDTPPAVRPPSPSPYARPVQPEPPLHGDFEPSPQITETAPPTTNVKLPKLSTQTLRQRIERACAGAVKNVVVEYDAADKLNVKMQLAEGAQQQRVIERVFAIPELLPYQGQIQLSLDLPAGTPQAPVIQESPPH